MRYSIVGMLCVAAAGVLSAQDRDPNLDKRDPVLLVRNLGILTKVVDKDSADGRKAVPQVVELLKHDGENVRIAAATAAGAIAAQMSAKRDEEAGKVAAKLRAALEERTLDKKVSGKELTAFQGANRRAWSESDRKTLAEKDAEKAERLFGK